MLILNDLKKFGTGDTTFWHQSLKGNRPMTEPVLTPGEWEALLYQAPTQVQHLIAKLAVHHGHLIAAPSVCSLCSANHPPVQTTLEFSR
jgi:hypothetical protein